MFEQVISCSLSPNTEPDDVWLAIRSIFAPWTWKNGEAIEQAEKWFKEYFKGFEAVSFNSGRSAMLAILKAFNIGVGDEVLVQAFTCVAVPNSVRWAEATPVYVDIDNTLNLSIADAETKVTYKTKAIVVQHTFGIPAYMDQIVAFTKKHKLYLIEDCAHSLGARYKGKKVGMFGDAAFFSFGRDKVVSSVFGGMALINQKSKIKNQKLKHYQEGLPYPSYFWIFQQLLHPIAFSFILLLYDVILGKLLLVLLQKLRLLSFPVYPQEKQGTRPNDFPAKFPNALAALLMKQLTKLGRYNQTRRSIVQYYELAMQKAKGIRSVGVRDGAIFLRYPLFVSDPLHAIALAKKRSVLLGNWYTHVIDPNGVDYRMIGYQKGTCPKAEEAAGHIINLPTRISKATAARVIAALC
ncbi:aminotransferase class I/II-fold pyridoxal phosphate-dependent enzyme [Candidatus Gottesmanbacteria bacterium]|nr:aminotransferase class I/II-fold pyridoxal phosphate-dependent enzyme [Candidatus Gottesmanbacteria bacterium]